MKKRALIILTMFAFGYWYVFSGVTTVEKNISIKTGDSLKTIGNTLSESEIIRSSKIFCLFARISGDDHNIKPGIYTFAEKNTVSEVLNTLTKGSSKQISITIPEGYSIYDIDKKLATEGLIKNGEFVLDAANLEGRLFPDTYFVLRDEFTPQQLIKKMRDNFDKKLSADLLTEITHQGRTVDEIVKMASILEKEVQTKKDLHIVSGILWKRLENEWAIQADATLLYGKDTNIITKNDLESNNPYNSRKHKGLPPTAIGNPGIATIIAAIRPESSPYWFYLTDAAGTVYYAKTNEEHTENKRKHL